MQMQIDPQDFLRLSEEANSIGFVDIEATGLRGDYNSTLIVSVKRYNTPPESFVVKQPGNDQKVVRDAKKCLEGLDCWVTFYGKGFDLPFLNTRLLRWRVDPIDKRPHVDLYFTLKHNLLTARKSQAHLLRFLNTPEQKMDMSPEDWNEVIANPEQALKKMRQRCESDVEGLQGLYNRTKHLIRDIKR
jgi:uncharacterized protein YprB with RNaseH-like and TPR domain